MLAAQEVIQARRHFIKVIGVKQVADSLIISQTQKVVLLVQERRSQVQERPQG